MKYIRHILMTLGCLLWLYSCSQGDSPEGDSRSSDDVITFSVPNTEENLTRSYLLKESDLNEFYVSAFIGTDHSADMNYFSNVRYYHKENKNGLKIFSSDSRYLWPGSDLEFFAYYPSLDTLNASVVNDANGYKLKGIKIPKDITDRHDFVTAHCTREYNDVLNDEKESKATHLQFNHQFCLVDVKAYSANTNYDYEVAGIRLGNTGMEGTYNFNGSWEEVTTDRLEYTYKFGEKVAILPKTKEEAVSLMGDGGQAMVIPTKNGHWENTYDKGSTSAGPTPTKQMYISVLIRVSRNKGVDVAFPYPHATEYPYPLDAAKSVKSEHYDAFYKNTVYLVVENDSLKKGEILRRVYDKGDYGLFYDADGELPFDWWSDDYYKLELYGWAAIPVDADWKPGNKYTYILDFSDGLGLHDPDDPDSGKPIHNVVHPTVTWGKRVNWGVKVNPWTAPKDFDPDVEIDFE